MRLVSWNINSVRARTGLVERLIDEVGPDVLCLQETKVQDHQFPRGFFNDLGYTHQALKGQKGHHGVATLSRLPLADTGLRDWVDRGDARYVMARIEGGPVIHNFYVPAGGDEPDPAINDKFDHKMKFLSEMTAWAKDLSGNQIVLGDLNIAPREEDVWSHKALVKVVSHTPVEVDALDGVRDAHGFIDVVRRDAGDNKLYSWWSYRARDWSKADKGRRLDHIWCSPDIADRAKDARVYREARGWEKPSDHAPVVVDFDL